MASLAIGWVAVAGTLLAQSTPARWTVGATPVLTIGESQADTNDMFAEVVGATRLPDGHVLVGDAGGYALRLFAADGKFVRRFGRKGSGPGEIGYLTTLLRCGDSVVTLDIDGNRTSVFSLGGQYVRVFRFSSPQAGRAAYKSVCNARGDFAHYGWESMMDAKGAAYRPNVPLWLSRGDEAPRAAIATIPGSERYGYAVDGKVRTSRPMPLGKQTAIALANDRVYVAASDRYEIAVYDFTGKPLAAIREDREPQATTKTDIDDYKARQFANLPGLRRAAAERDLDELPLPKTLPAYSELIIDAAGYLWAQEYTRGASTTATWYVYDQSGQRVTSVAVPKHLHVYEIGGDYLLGRYFDPEEAVPLVRMYRLSRGR